MDAEVMNLVDEISRSHSGLKNGEAGARERMIDQAYKLISALELPSETIQRMGWAEPAKLAHCEIAGNLEIFDILAKHSPECVDTKTLALSTKANEAFLSRLLKHLAAMNVIEEVAKEKYKSTPFSLALAEQRFRDGIKYIGNVAGPSFHAMPKYFQKINYDNPTSLADGPFQFAHGTQSSFFAWLGENPEFLQAFNNYMGAYRAGKPTWSDPGFYPVLTNLINGFETSVSPVFLVDVGGGLGHDLEELKSRHPDLPGKLILQDRPEVISAIPSESVSTSCHVFEATANDFFTGQPVKQARAYYLHSVLHDWADEDCVKILSQIVPALKRGYSKVLINEIVVPSCGASWPVTSMDWLMMALGAMRERTQREWESIVEQAGLKVTKIYTYDLGMESLIEAELA